MNEDYNLIESILKQMKIIIVITIEGRMAVNALRAT